VHYHSPKVHYEVWLSRKNERIEIGLHFEGPRDFSYRWCELFAGHMLEAQAQLGPDWDLEEWTASWARFHQMIPYDPPSPALAGEIASRMAQLIAVCQPIIEMERINVAAATEAEAYVRTKNRGWHGKRRG
jgi:hypothetical protein